VVRIVYRIMVLSTAMILSISGDYGNARMMAPRDFGVSVGWGVALDKFIIMGPIQTIAIGHLLHLTCMWPSRLALHSRLEARQLQARRDEEGGGGGHRNGQ
jgi:hypothetical protein